MMIGDVELPIVFEVTPLIEAEVDEIKSLKSYSDSIDSIPVKHEGLVEEITIGGYLNSETHSQHLSIEQQKKDLKSLRRKSKFDNSFTYKDYNGYLLVDEVNLDDSNEYRIVNEVEIVARYFPWPKYYSGDKP